MGARKSYKIEEQFLPSDITAISEWWRNETLSGTISSVPDVLNSNPMVQSTAGRRPTGNADGSISFITDDVLTYPVLANVNDFVDRIGFAGHYKPNGVATTETLFANMTGIGGMTLNRWEVRIASGRLAFRVHIADSTGRQGLAPVASITTAGAFIVCFYDNRVPGAAEATKLRCWINGVLQTLAFSNIGAGGTLDNLQVASGNGMLGAQNAGAVPSQPCNGIVGRNNYLLKDPLSATEMVNLGGFESPL